MPRQRVFGNGVGLCAVVYGLWWEFWGLYVQWAPASIDGLL